MYYEIKILKQNILSLLSDFVRYYLAFIQTVFGYG